MNQNKTIMHVDMDAFYASVEVRDHPELAGKPVIVGADSKERGVVTTCSYEARRFGVHSAMNIKEAYRRCPDGIYIRPDMAKYKSVSAQIHEIWCSFTDQISYVSLDEGYLDVTESLLLFGGAVAIARQIKERTKAEIGLTCSVGIGYSMASAKFASEEKKPDGLFIVKSPAHYKLLTGKRGVDTLIGIGPKSVQKLRDSGIVYVEDILTHRIEVEDMFGARGRRMISLADGIDDRELVPYYLSEAKSIGREQTFRYDTENRDYVTSYLRLFAREISGKIKKKGLYFRTVTLKITYGDMKTITRAKSVAPTDRAEAISEAALELFEGVDYRPIRLAGVSVSHFENDRIRQITMDDLTKSGEKRAAFDSAAFELRNKFGTGTVKTAAELAAEKLIREKEEKKDEKKDE